MQSGRHESANEQTEDLRLILDAIRHIVQTMRTFSSTSEAEVGLSAAQLDPPPPLDFDQRVPDSDMVA